LFKHILIPIDGSDTSLRAVEELSDVLLPDSTTQVTLLIAICVLDAAKTDFDPDYVVRHNEALHRKAQSALQRAAQRALECGHTCQTKVIEGDPVSAAIAAEAKRGDYDLIIMGSRGLGMHKTDMHYLGSVTDHVIRQIETPVLVIPIHKLSKGRDEK